MRTDTIPTEHLISRSDEHGNISQHDSKSPSHLSDNVSIQESPPASGKPIVVTSQQHVNVLNSTSDSDFCQYIDSVIEGLQAKGFVPLPRGIHNPKAIMFYQNVLQANDYVINLLEWGYFPRLISRPPNVIDLKNNKSARQHIQFVRDKTTEWCEKGYVQKVADKPRFVNPLTVAVKMDTETGNLKLRQCVDLCRSLNDHIAKESMAMEDVSTVLPRVTTGAWMSVLDVASMYCHLSLAKQARTLFGFAVENEAGQREFYVCLTMPFGTGKTYNFSIG